MPPTFCPSCAPSRLPASPAWSPSQRRSTTAASARLVADGGMSRPWPTCLPEQRRPPKPSLLLGGRNRTGSLPLYRSAPLALGARWPLQAVAQWASSVRFTENFLKTRRTRIAPALHCCLLEPRRSPDRFIAIATRHHERAPSAHYRYVSCGALSAALRPQHGADDPSERYACGGALVYRMSAPGHKDSTCRLADEAVLRLSSRGIADPDPLVRKAREFGTVVINDAVPLPDAPTGF